MTEQQLLDKIKDNPAAFSEIFRQYYSSIFGYIFRRTGNFDDSADIAAETFFNAFTHIKKFSYKGISIKVWLYRIATNEVNLFYRRQKRYHSRFKTINYENEELLKNYLLEDRAALEDELSKHEQFRTILKYLKTLPPRYQEVISLRYFEGMNNEEIAEILNLKDGTLKSLLSRGMQKLREKCNQS